MQRPMDFNSKGLIWNWKNLDNVEEAKNNDNLITYYDVEKDSFRSFIKENFLGIL